jgi:hypothetical protein
MLKEKYFERQQYSYRNSKDFASVCTHSDTSHERYTLVYLMMLSQTTGKITVSIQQERPWKSMGVAYFNAHSQDVFEKLRKITETFSQNRRFQGRGTRLRPSENASELLISRQQQLWSVLWNVREPIAERAQGQKSQKTWARINVLYIITV